MLHPLSQAKKQEKKFSKPCAQVLHIFSRIVQKMPLKKTAHTPVLLKEILEMLLTKNVATVFDGTLGLGGHGEAILEEFNNVKKYIGCDLDLEHLNFAQERLEAHCDKAIFRQSNFSEIKKIIQELNIIRPLVILLDLGICSHHVDNPEKGFSFEKNGPLRMSFDTQNETNCEKIVNEANEKSLTQIFREFGEEPLAPKISRKIIEARKHGKIKTTGKLKEIIENTTHPTQRKKTLMRIFQALRIATNQELEHLEKTLHDAWEIMLPGDRIGIIAYHSLEDRMVKKFFLEKSKPVTAETEFSLHEEVAPAEGSLLTRKPIVPTDEEIAANPRARSAKLRILEKS